ncbi:putative lipid II flippase MurJ [Iodidimonas nitroreducens]|uniref:Probable lipid II flippase MurJ n=1 Tax=Iodidimonas nitroreducens TaxID=1236968 RepID=A0A5A7N2J4_9PROT|nr:murein biosynthesis integral membrane protein MurJ [Iodidimonas nitroreducens]GAK34776.1 hypothetical protein AQ1_02683 [alpha proteobacterium Q-1]GER02511.1 putative lipid II flippase MurJ [Iodidimonas nitroreducens]
MSMMRGFTTVGAFTLISRILGFVRDILMAQFLGAGLAADCFFVAFKLPNFFRRLFAEGAFSSAFVPLFAKLLGRHPHPRSIDAARAFAQDALAILLPVLLLLMALMQLFMPFVMLALAPGFVDQPDKFALAIDLTRLTFPYLVLISLVSLFSGVLNGLGRFAEAAAAPVLLNIILIAALLLFHDNEMITAKALAVAVSLAGMAQLLMLVLAARRAGWSLSLPRPRLTPSVKHLLTVMIPVALGAGMTQVNLVIDIILASLLPEGALSYLFYADRLNQFPLGVIGIAVGTVLLPHLSRTLADSAQGGAHGGDGVSDAANAQHNRAVEFALILTLPAAFALITIAGPLITTLFEHGAFSADDSGKTARALMAFAFGLPAFVLIKVLVPGFYAREDMKTPVKIAMLALFVNLGLNLLLMGPLGHVGLALSTSLAAWLNAGLLYVFLRKRRHLLLDQRFKTRLWRALFSCLAMVVVLLAIRFGLVLPADAHLWPRIGLLAALVFSGMAAYGLSAVLTGAVVPREIRRLRRPDA